MTPDKDKEQDGVVVSSAASAESNGPTESDTSEISLKDKIKEEFIKLNEDGLYDLHGEKKRAIAGFIELAKNDRDSALELFRELMQEGNFAAVELMGAISRDQNIGTRFKLDIKEAFKLIADKLEGRIKGLEVQGNGFQNQELARKKDTPRIR